jgi:4-amino-4-deoxy-L-arabinose transferase-like glycosyltransferase
MKRRLRYLGEHKLSVLAIIAGFAGLGFLMFYKLGSLVGGIAPSELTTTVTPLGWHGIIDNPLYLPLKAVRSAVFYLSPDYGQYLLRAPNALFGALSVISFAWLIWLWHGRRTAILTTLLFATSAWTLHVSRLANFDVMYLWAVVTLLLSHVLIYRFGSKPYVWYICLFAWGILLTIPGMVWLVMIEAVLQRSLLLKGWRDFSRWWQRLLTVIMPFVWLPLVGYALYRDHGLVRPFLGLPDTFAQGSELAKQFGGVPVHLFVRGPQYPDLWLDRVPILSIFTLAVCLLGIYFYVTKWKSARSRLLATLFIVGFVLVGFKGPVSLSLLVPVLYVVAATGIAYLLHEWLKVFPRNPLARGLGIGLVALAVAVSCTYNLRAYFVAWPHNPDTKATFRYHR